MDLQGGHRPSGINEGVARLTVEEKFQESWGRLGPWPHPITLLLSGGGDSVALFHLLVATQEDFQAIHFVHDGESQFALQSRDFCRDLCQQFSVNLKECELAGRPLAAQGDLSWEAACRHLRYQALKGLPGCFLTAHTADDQAETLIMRLVQGSGLAGLSGIHQRREDRVLRPLLGFSRESIRQYLKSAGYRWVEDPSNEDGNLRAHIRNRVMPLLTELNPGLRQTLSRSAAIFAQDEDCLAGMLEEWGEKNTGDLGDWWALAALRELPDSLLSRFLKKLWRRMTPPEHRPRRKLFQEGQNLVRRAKDSSELRFPGGWALQILGEKLWLRPRLESCDMYWEFCSQEQPGCEGWRLNTQRSVRCREAGDRFRGRCLKKILATTGHPPWVRDRWPLLVEGERILAVHSLGRDHPDEEANCWLRFRPELLRAGHNSALLRKE